ncbi:hypothetical protein D3C84_856600 [compost metagenome]
MTVCVVEHRATTDGAGFRIDLVVDEVHLPEVAVALLVRQAHVHRRGLTALALAGKQAVLEEHALVRIEIGVDLVGGDHAGQRCSVGGHDVAGGDFRTADAAGDRRGNAGETEVQTRQIQLRLNGIDTGPGLLRRGRAGVGELCGDRVAAQ